MSMKKRIIILVVSLIIITGIIVGVSYAFFSTGGKQETANTFTSGCLNISLTDVSSSINLSNTYPITDIEGLDTTSYDFTITNTCNTDANYEINLESLNQVSNSLSADYLKVSLSSDTVGNVISILSDNTSVTPEIDNAYEAYNLYTGTLKASETKTYHLKLWLDYDATVEQAANKVYQSKINVVANPDIQVVDTLEAKFTIKNTTVTSTLTENVTSATYCTTTDNICEPTTTATITNNSYTIELEEKTKEVATALGNLTVNESTTEVVCTRLNGTSKVICSNPRQINTPDFNKTAQANCGGIENCEETNGIYEAKDDDGTSYYYRGTVDNNWVQFGGFYWRIIRINGDGSIRMIYSGDEESGPVEIGEATLIGTSAFNEKYNDNAYVGYMYGTTGSSTYEETHANINDSTIKTMLDEWYQINLLQYADKIDGNAGFCGDRTPSTNDSTSNGSGGTGTTMTYYGGYIRLIVNKAPTFECTNSSDLYTTSGSSQGNGTLTYPIGLITADEIVYAGIIYGSKNDKSYLYNAFDYWTITSGGFYVDKEHPAKEWSDVLTVGPAGQLSSWGVNNITFGIRPVINLKSDVQFSEGIGTASNPYVVVE